MIDLHTHILNNVDDGSKSIDETIALIEELISQGVSDVVLTPHQKYTSSRFKSKDEIVKVFNELPKFDNINIYLGSEIYYVDDIEQLIEDNILLTMNNSKTILVEFSTSVDYDIIDMIQGLYIKGYKVIVAHVERYTNLTIDDICELKQYSLIQVNCNSFFDTFKKSVKKLMNNNLVDIISSDAHNLTSRRPNMKKAYDYVVKKYGNAVASKLFYENAKESLSI